MKRVLSILIVLLLVGGIFVFVGCGDKETTVEKLTIKFEPLNDAAIADLEIKADSTFSLPSPTREGYVFQGWFLEDTYQTQATVDSLKQMLKEGNVTLYAKWEEDVPPAPTGLTVHFNAKGGNAVTDATLQADTEYTLPVATREGYDFKGWFFEEGYQTAVTVEGLKAKIADGATTIYAKWEEKTVTLSFNVMGGNELDDHERLVGYAVIDTIVLPRPTRSGNYIFARWYFDENYQTPYSARGLKERISEGTVTLYAKWGDVLPSSTITVQGKVGDYYVLNPVFDWSNEYNDSGFRFQIKDMEGNTVVDQNVSGTHFELSDNLAYDTVYSVQITGLTSDCFRNYRVATVSGTGEVDLNEASIALAEPFKSHMVIQRDKAITIAGMTAPKTLVSIDFYGERKYAISDGSTGMFTFAFAAKEANATPANVTISLLKTKNLVLEDVLIGDVYLVSGQSNVQRTLAECSEAGKTPDWAVDVPDAITYGVRYYYQAEHTSATPSNTTANAFWSKVTEGDNSYKQYSAVAFMVGAMLGKGLADEAVPVGIIYSAKGNTNITSWKGDAGSQHYNGMIYPLRAAEISGVVWYQGCNNSGKGIDYQAHLTDLMANWRALFRNAELPFYVVQLPCYNGDSGNNYDFSFVRESQLKACEADDNAYLIATCDGGEADEIHPKEKRYLCERIAKSILSTVYGQDYLPEGPTYASHEVQGSNVVITVKNGEGLTFTGEAIVGFQLAGEDGKYFDATATINEGKLVVTSTEVAAPVYIKYGFSKCPWLNVYNKDGFLMSPFRTDVYNHNIDLLDYREGAVYTSNPNGETMQYEIVDVDGEVGLQVTKPAGSKNYGILQLDKWGAIGGEEHGLYLRLKGSGSGATLKFRIVEGSYEMWSTPDLVDDFNTVLEMVIPFSYLVVEEEKNGIPELQSVMRVELIIKNKAEAVTITVLGAKFVDYVRKSPDSFTIKDAKNDGTEGTIKWSFSDYATSYRVIVSADALGFSDPVYEGVTTDLNKVFDSSVLTENVDYYVKVVAVNELGEIVATNNGMLLRSTNRATVADFHFDDQDNFNSYIAAKLYNENSDNLEFLHSDKGLKVHIKKTSGWMAFFARVDAGTSAGFDTLKVYLDLTEYKGNSIKIQLQTNGGSTSYTHQLNYSSKKEGYFEIPFSSFVNTAQNLGAYSSGDIVRVKFGFEDYKAGETDNVYIGNIEFTKTAQS